MHDSEVSVRILRHLAIRGTGVHRAVKIQRVMGSKKKAAGVSTRRVSINFPPSAAAAPTGAWGQHLYTDAVNGRCKSRYSGSFNTSINFSTLSSLKSTD